jgi:DNA-binding winged helix-turn-helix (wHTH) protein
MASSTSLWFPPFRLDLSNQSLWREEQETVLKPKTFALLALLVKHAGRLVTKQEILTAVWPGVTVNEEVVTARIKELRRLLGDERKTSRYIQTVHGRGYRFPFRGRVLEGS